MTYLDIVKIEGEETQYTFYQYYKTCNIDKSYTIDRETIKPLYEGNKQDRTKNHTDYILKPGFFYTGTTVSPLKLVSYCFANCTNLKGQIPPNLFRTMSNVTSLEGVFSGCTSLGLTSAFTEEMARVANNDRELTRLGERVFKMNYKELADLFYPDVNGIGNNKYLIDEVTEVALLEKKGIDNWKIYEDYKGQVSISRMK